MSVPDIDTLKCVFLEFSSRRRMIGCIFEEVFNQFMSPEGMKESFDLFYPVDVSIVPNMRPNQPPVSSASAPEDNPTIRMYRELGYTGQQFKMWYVYLPNCDYAKPSEPVIRISGPTIETMHLYDEKSDTQLNMIYDIEARNKIPSLSPKDMFMFKNKRMIPGLT
jgi:hypothetical protein